MIGAENSSVSGPEEVEVHVTRRRTLARGVVELELCSDAGVELPAWTPGAHIDVLLDDGKLRQYSLCGAPANRGHYRIAVLRQDDGRGGSVRIHDTVVAGSKLRIRGPRNHFPFYSAPDHIFIAGGIGITPSCP